MTVACLILFVVTAVLWFFSKEYAEIFGIYVPACVLKRAHFKLIVAVCLLASVAFVGASGVRSTVNSFSVSGSFSCIDMIVTLLSSLMTLSLLNRFNVRGSAAYAIMGGFYAVSVMEGTQGGCFPVIILSILAATVLAFVFSYLIRLVLKVTVCRSHVHMMILSHYMRYAVIVAIVLSSIALGINWGGFLIGGSDLVCQGYDGRILIVPIMAAALFSMASLIRKESDESAGRYGDFSIYAILAIGFSVSAVMLLFSFDATVSFISLVPVPLAAGSLVTAAIGGSEMAERSHLIESEDHVKELAAILFAPTGSFLFTSLLLWISGNGEDGDMLDFAVIVSSILVLAALAFAGYVRHQRRQKEAVDRLVYSQQQQIYENSRALNDMELKVVLSENQALHNAVEMKRQEVMNVALSIVEQREYLESLESLVKRLSKTYDDKERDGLIAELGNSLKQRLSYDRDVDSQYFYAQAESLHEDFSAKLAENFPALTQQERRLATLLRLGFSSKYIATLMNITPKSVEISRYRLRQKLGLSKGDNLVNFIKSI